MLDNTRLRAELAHIQQTLSGVAAGTRGKSLLDDLRRELGGTTAALLWQSLFADCLRVVHSAVAADGVIGDDEIEALYEFLFSVARHYANTLPVSYSEFAAIDHESARTFLEHYAADAGPVGRGAEHHWPGLTLCRRAAEIGESEALERYERMMTWLITVACQIGGVTEADPRWQGRIHELAELRQTLARNAKVTPPATDLRVQAFLKPSRVFAAVQQASSVFEADPFDVESIHAEARASFGQMVERATTPALHSDRGRMLLVLGDSGAGKTHLLRSFRQQVHEFGRGFVAYAQLHSSSEDYARYLLNHVIDSLSRPYAGPRGESTGLHELASGLPRLLGEPLKSQIARLIDDDWDSPDSLADYVNHLVDDLLREPDLASFDPDLLRVLLYALYPDPGTTSRVYKYLRCESMNAHDRRRIGDIAPRTDRGDPDWMIRQLGRLAFVTQHAALVLMVDQAELTTFDASSIAAFQRAIDTLNRIVSEVPSAIAVVACLSDLYNKVRGELSKFALDRLEKDPPIERLQLNRSHPEIEEIVGRRLSWLFAEAGAVYRPETPVYPISEQHLRGLAGQRTRAILEWCHQFQAQCAAAGKIIDADKNNDIIEDQIPHDLDLDLDQIATAWNDAMHAPDIEVPDSDGEILSVMEAAAKACADEAGLVMAKPPRKNGVLRVELAGASQRAELVIAVTNRSYQRGAFASQIEALRKDARGATPVAMRTIEFPRGPACDKVMANLLKAGGKRAHVDVSTLRTLVAFQRFQPPFPVPRVAAWRRRDRPISSLPSMAELFDLERLRAAPPQVSSVNPQAVPDAQPATQTPPRGTASQPPDKPTSTHPNPTSTHPNPTTTSPPHPTANGTATTPPRATAAPASQLRVGTSSGFQADARTIEISSLLRHTGILGSPGSGKTTLALNLIEQVLERNVGVVLVDRKGDLAGYAKPDWWKTAADPERARRLADRVDVRLFTPGTRGGRPLSLSVIPDLDGVPEHERDRMVQYAAAALGAMMRLGDAANDTARRAILTQAIDILAGHKASGGLPQLITLLEDRDEALVSRAGRYDDRLFKRLVQDLETVRLSDADLFDPAAELLSAETLLGRRPDGKVPLTIASTRFLGDVERIQSWVAHLIACLARHVAKAPRAELHTVLMIDEADLFMPAGAAKPPSKEPLQDLLRRARSGGLGVMLASQSPADFDYRSREQINTWFLGRIADQRSIGKMKPLFEHRPTVGSKLGILESGRFVMLQDGNAADLDRTPCLLRTDQLAEDELMALAARLRPAT